MSDSQSNEGSGVGRMIDRMRELESENARLRGLLPANQVQDRELVALDGQVDDPFEVPDGAIFASVDRFNDQFSRVNVGGIDTAIEGLIRKNWPQLSELSIAVRWARKGGEDRGRPRAARARVLAGEARHAFRSDLLITIGWDWFRLFHPTQWQVERLIDRELRRVQLKTTPKGPKLSLREPDYVAYLDEVAAYGVWDLGMSWAAESFRQMPLWSMDPGLFGDLEKIFPIPDAATIPEREAAE